MAAPEQHLSGNDLGMTYDWNFIPPTKKDVGYT
jgi:hypothetical protein